MRLLIPFLILVMLSSCATKPDQSPMPQLVEVPVTHRVTTTKVKTITVEKRVPSPPCVKAEEIPDEPPLISDKLTGVVNFDIGPLVNSARSLRTALRTARELLIKCADKDH